MRNVYARYREYTDALIAIAITVFIASGRISWTNWEVIFMGIFLGFYVNFRHKKTPRRALVWVAVTL